MQRNRVFIGSLVALVALTMVASDAQKHTAKPEGGFVPDAKTAIKIAVAVWEPIYGEKETAREKPYRAHLGTNGVWVVEGSLRQSWLSSLLGDVAMGGVAIAEIAKDDARVLRVSHGR
jgi:hypothetical protein